MAKKAEKRKSKKPTTNKKERITKKVKESHATELAAYLRYKKRVFDDANISDTDSSASEGEVKRKRKLSYFDGDGIKKWTPKSELVVGSVNVTRRLLKFRAKNILLAEEINSVNSLRLLSLSHVFPVDKFDNKRCISYYYSSLKNCLHSYAYQGIDIKKVSVEAVFYCKEAMDAFDESRDIEEIEYKPTSVIDVRLKDALLGFSDVVAESNTNSESTFVDRFIIPFIKKVILKKANLVFAVADGYDTNSVKKPDVMIGFRDKDKLVNIIFFEVKRPDTTSKYQAENDLVKLLKQLKSSIDFQVKSHIKSPVLFGVLCEGFECSLIQMKLVEDGIYLPITIRKFKLPNSTASLLNIPRIVECLNHVSEELVQLEQRYLNRNKSQITIEHEFVKSSFVTSFQ